MKKKHTIIVFLIALFIFMERVNASSLGVNCEPSIQVDVGEMINCKINVTTTKPSVGFKAVVTYANGLKYVNYVGDSSFNTDYVNGVISGLVSDKKPGTYLVGTLQLTTDKNTKTNPYFSIKGGVCEEGESSCNGEANKTISFKVKNNTTTTTTTTKQKSGNNYLSSITIDGEKVEDFSKNKSKYFVTVKNNVEKVNIKAVAEDDTAKLEISGPKMLEVGDNEYTIGVTSEDNTTKFYKVIVTREDEGKSTNTKLKGIKVKDYHFSFDKNSKTFYLTIKKEDTKLDITVTTDDKKAKYEIIDNENLKDGSIIKINVTAENGDEDTYRIIIKKEEKSILPIMLGAGFILVIIIVIVILVIKNKKSKNKKDGSNSDKKTNDKVKKDDGVTQEQVVSGATKRMPVINDAQVKNEVVDNDEEEETRFLSYEEQEALEKTKVLDLDDELGNLIDSELERTISFNREDD